MWVRPHCSVAVLGVLGGALSGSFCFPLTAQAVKGRKALWGGLKEETGRVLFSSALP